MYSDIIIAEIEESEIIYLEDFLYEAIYKPDENKINREITYLPEIYRYIKNFGRENDICFVAKYNAKIIGVIWSRIFSNVEPGFGYVDAETPQISMSVLKNFQQQGIGTFLLETIIKKLQVCGYKQVSLSVNLNNFVINLYYKYGFEVYKKNENSAIMIKPLINDGKSLDK